jgi:cytochrome c oxidase assembly factor CtaG
MSASSLIFAEWSPPWPLTLAILVFAVAYVRGFFAIRKTRPGLFPEWRLVSYLLGMLTLWLSLASPLDGFADALLSAHMVQHLLLMSVVPALVLLGAPMVPILRGLPRGFTRVVLGPLFSSKSLLAIGRFLTRPVVAWLAMNLTFLLWHTPAAYDFALWNGPWHRLEHVCFLTTSFLFWWPVIQPWPARRRNYGWGMLLYLLTADFVNTALAAFLAFCDRPVYSYYVEQPSPFHVDPVSDQALGGVIMWVTGSMVFLLPAVVLTMRILQGPARARRAQRSAV